MARGYMLLLACALALLASMASAKVVEHTFNCVELLKYGGEKVMKMVWQGNEIPWKLLSCIPLALVSAGKESIVIMIGNMTFKPLCKEQVIVAVNGRLPGPIIRVNEGDTLVVHVLNESPYNMTVHWHGIFQLLSAWADGPGYVTQCPILPGSNYTYRFNITGQEGTLWWHAHSSWLRATVYGALLIYPRAGRSYPFPKPHREFPIVLGEWWDANVVDVENDALLTGGAPTVSDAYTINGKAGDLYPCNTNYTHKIRVVPGRTYMLRIINAALNNQLFFKVAGHNLTVVAIDASYTVPFPTDVVIVAPGQTTDVLLVANQAPGYYYMAARPYISAVALVFNSNNSTTTGVIQYENANSSTPLMPVLPETNDTDTAHRFLSNLTALISGPPRVPLDVDQHMFVTFGLGLEPCQTNATCTGFNGMRFSASMNNVSFRLPSTLSMQQAHFLGKSGIFTDDFPDLPPAVFDYTNANVSFDPDLWTPLNGTRVKRLPYNSTVEIVLQNTAILGTENHPMHLHGFNFFVLAQGFGNFNRTRDARLFNLVNPQERNTAGVPVGGWAVIRFRANNPGVWLMHCHLDVHLPWGLAMAFVIDNGPTPSSTLPPPPEDLPRC